MRISIMPFQTRVKAKDFRARGQDSLREPERLECDETGGLACNGTQSSTEGSGSTS